MKKSVLRSLLKTRKGILKEVVKVLNNEEPKKETKKKTKEVK